MNKVKMKGLRFAIVTTIGLLVLSALQTWAPVATADPPIPDSEPRLATPVFAEPGMIAPCYTGCGGEFAPIVNASYEQEVMELVNAVRADNNLPPLKRAIELDEAARYHATDMGQDDYFDHDSYDRDGGGLTQVCGWAERVRSYYPGGTTISENIAAGYSTPQSVMNGWMNSSGHRANILRTSTWEIGVGYYQGSGGYYRYWAQDFGRRSGIYPLIINREAATTNWRDVSLYIYGDWDEVRLRNDDGLWTDWQPFQSTLDWSLSGGDGIHTVRAEMRTDSQTASSNDSIYLDLADVPPASVEIGGPTTGLAGINYTFTATISPADTTQPVTYTWQAQGLPQVIHTGGLSDTATFAWETPGDHTITVTATNSGGTATDTYVITISAIPLAGVEISGPTTGFFNTSYTFVATASPGTTTPPITYIWKASGQPQVTHTSGLSDVATFTWPITGSKTITVTATNNGGATMTATHAITITAGPSVIVRPTVSSTLVYTDGQGNVTTVFVPAGSVVETATLRLIPLTTTKTHPQGYAFTNHAFILEARWNGTLLLDFARPVTITIHYSDADVTTIDEDSLRLYYWDASGWVNAATTCSPSLVFGPQPDENWLAADVCRLGEFALFGRQWRIYLPLVLRS
ncbi:MAG: CAP domain-containing protein [Chloroflexota bacterium]|nr:CAP domain-containing protein [Chloroflexota bacterium]